MSSILNIPHEIFYLIAKFDLDLLDLGALLWSCKTLSERVGEDLALQKLFLDNTNVMLRGPSGTAVRRKYVESKTAYGIRCNDPDGVLMSFPTLMPKEILKAVKVANAKINRDLNRQVILDDIANFDSDKVLDFITKAFVDNQSDERRALIVELISLLIGHFLNITQLLGTTAANYVNSIKTKKTVAVIMRHVHDQQDIILSDLIMHFPHTNSWANANAPAGRVLEALFKLFTAFPQFKFDVNAPIKSDNSPYLPGFNIHPLEFAIISCSVGGFTFLIKQGSKFDPKAPYLPLALLKIPYTTTTTIFSELHYYKCDINKRLPAYYGRNRPTTVLGETIRINMQQYISQRDHCFVEYLLNQGAKLSKEEEDEYIKEAPTSWVFKIAKLQQEKSYNTYNRVAKLEVTRLRMEFTDGHNWLILYQDGEFEYMNMGTYYGDWRNGNEEGSVICTSTTKKQYAYYGSWGGMEEIVNERLVIRFSLFRMYDDTIAIQREKIAGKVQEDWMWDLWRLKDTN